MAALRAARNATLLGNRKEQPQVSQVVVHRSILSQQNWTLRDLCHRQKVQLRMPACRTVAPFRY